MTSGQPEAASTEAASTGPARELTGGCLCGAVRYRLAAPPFDTGYCHCRVCQKSSGAPVMVFTTVSLADFVIERGEQSLGSVRATEFGTRRFCRECGTPLTIQVTFQPDTIDIAAATLDDPALVVPQFHIWRESRIGWFETPDDCRRYPQFRPDTRGL